MPTLYVVASPIGNLQDITLRALETLRAVDIIACEDTRRTRKLLSHFQIAVPTVVYGHDESRARRVIGLLEAGNDVALVTDAGTPGVSDPGSAAVLQARAAGYEVVPIPGVSAATTLLSVCGHGSHDVCLYGFLSPKPGRRRRQLGELLERGAAFLLFEAPHRVAAVLTDLAELASERNIVAGRELTKLHEEILDGSATSILTELQRRPKIVGEFTLLVSRADRKQQRAG